MVTSLQRNFDPVCGYNTDVQAPLESDIFRVSEIRIRIKSRTDSGTFGHIRTYAVHRKKDALRDRDKGDL